MNNAQHALLLQAKLTETNKTIAKVFGDDPVVVPLYRIRNGRLRFVSPRNLCAPDSALSLMPGTPFSYVPTGLAWYDDLRLARLSSVNIAERTLVIMGLGMQYNSVWEDIEQMHERWINNASSPPTREEHAVIATGMAKSYGIWGLHETFLNAEFVVVGDLPNGDYHIDHIEDAYNPNARSA